MELQSFSAIVLNNILIPIVVVVLVVVLVVVVLVVVILIFVSFKGNSVVKLDVLLKMTKSDSLVVLNVIEVVVVVVEIMVVCRKKRIHSKGGPPIVRSPKVRIPLIRILVL